MEENKNKFNKKRVILILVIVVIVIAMLAGIASYLILRNNEKINNGGQNIEKNEEVQNVINTELPVSAKITNEVAQNKITNEQTQNETNKVEKKEDIKEETTNKTDKTNKSEKTETANKEVSKSTQTTSKKEETSSSKDSNKTTKKENTSTTNNSNKNTTTDSVKNTKPKLTGTEDEKKLVKSETRYGVIVRTYTYTIYNVYSDGSKEVKSTTTTTGYERDNYKATTSELLAEAKSVRSKYSGMISQILKNVNIYREEANTANKNDITNRGALTLDEQLCVAASVRAVEMAYSTKYSHTRPNGTSCITVLDEMGISYMTAGENIATGQTTAASVSKSWKNSPGHYENMISEKFSKIGIGVCKLDSAYYWVQLFTN